MSRRMRTVARYEGTQVWQIELREDSLGTPMYRLFGKSNQLSGELIGRRVHLRSKTHRVLQKATCDRFPQVIEVLPNDAKT